MKLTKLLFTSVLLLTVISIRAQVTIGSGHAPANAALLDLKTLEPGTVTSVTDDSNITSTKGGLLLPRVKLVSLTSLEPFITGATNEQNLKHAGLLVHNLNETNGMQHATYQWDGKQWKLFVMDTEWNYDATTDEEKVYLKRGKSSTGEFGADVYINKNGGIVNTDQDMSATFNSYALFKRDASFVDKTSTSTSLDYNVSYLNIDPSSTYLNYNGIRSNVILPLNNTNRYSNIYAFTANSSSASPNSVTRIIGSFNSAGNAGAGGVSAYLAGSFNQAVQAGGGTVEDLIGTRTYSSFRGAGRVRRAFGLQTSMVYEPTHSGIVDSVSVIYAQNRWASNNTQVGTLMGIRFNLNPYISDGEGTSVTGMKVDRVYGLYMDDVNIANDNDPATIDNYAIYTNKGENRLGDILSVHSFNTSTDPDNAIYPLRLYNDANQGAQVTGIEFWNSSAKVVPTARIVTKMAGNASFGDNIYFQTQSNSSVNPNPNMPTTKMTITAEGNVGIATETPRAKLEVGGSIILANDGETSNQGTIRYNADTDKFQGRTLNNGWQDFHPNQGNFYLPAFNLSLTAGVGGTDTVDLYSIYERQYKGQSGKFVSSDASITQVPTIYPANKIAFLVLDYDDSVITVNKIEGSVMHYKINSINPSSTSYINILCVIKN